MAREQEQINYLDLRKNLNWYLLNKDTINPKYYGRWILIHDTKVVDDFPDYGSCVERGNEFYGLTAGFACMPIIKA